MIDSKIRKHSYDDEKTNIGIDFDGVIHKNSKGYYDGTIYDKPIAGSINALKKISKIYRIIIFTVKAKPDRPIINGKTGTQLVWEWLELNGIAEYISDVTAEKPRAVAYIDDKGIKFVDWKTTLDEINEIR